MVKMVGEEMLLLQLMKKSIRPECSVWSQILHLGQIIIRAHAICTSVNYFSFSFSFFFFVLFFYLYSVVYWSCSFSNIFYVHYLFINCRWQNKQWLSLHKQLTFVRIKSCTIFRSAHVFLTFFFFIYLSLLLLFK
jgi:hypothetical protein